MRETDTRIRKRLIDRLGWDVRIDPSEVDVVVENGAVTLGGEVANYSARSAAVEAAWAVPGVREVRDHLSVRRPEGPDVVPTDAEIRERVANLIAWNPSLDEKDIEVKVAEGIVTLQGSVDAHWKRDSVEGIAAGVHGVLEIRNELAVAPTKELSDKDLAREVISAFERDASVSATQIEVRAENGLVTLAGKVHTPAARKAAEAAASRTFGVTGVRNNVEVVMTA